MTMIDGFRWLHTGPRGAATLFILLASQTLLAQTANVTCEDIKDDDFSLYVQGDLDGQGDWEATPSASVAVVQVTGTGDLEAIPGVGAADYAWFRPLLAQPSTLRPWAFDRVYRRFHSVEFNLRPVFSSGVAGDEGWFSVYLSPEGATVPGTVDVRNPIEDDVLIACRMIATLGPNAEQQCRAEFWVGAKDPQTGQWSADPFLPSIAITNIPDFQPNTLRRFRVDFGWDWWRVPGGYAQITPDNQKGDGRLFLRLWYKDDQGVWQNPADDGKATYGWWESFPSTQGSGAGSIGPDNFDWDGLSPNAEVFPYFTAEASQGDVNWRFDDVHLCTNRPLPVSIMANTVGYDTAGPQWAWVVVNDSQYRNAGAPVGSNAITITSATLRCCDNPP